MEVFFTLLWVRGHSRLLKLVSFKSLGADSYSPSIVTMAVSVAVCEIFGVKACDLANWLGVVQVYWKWRQTSARNSDGVTSCGGAKYRWGTKISRFSTNKSLYLADDTRQRRSYYGRRIELVCDLSLVPFQMTLNEPLPCFQGHTIFWRWISHKRLQKRP